MELKNDHEEQQPSSEFQGGEFWISTTLAREVSKGQSSRSYYRAAEGGEGVPFKWETNPGTPKNPQEEDQIFPLCPSPLMQSLGLPLHNLEDHDHVTKESAFKTSIISSLRKLVKNNVIGDISKMVEKLGSWRSKKQESSACGDSNGEFVGCAKGSNFSSNSSLSTFSSSSRVLDAPSVDHDPFCCDPLDFHAILDEGSTRLYFCTHHKIAFAVEEDNSFHSEQTPAGIPFIWETQPGTPKTLPDDELKPPPPAGIPFIWETQPGTPKPPPDDKLIPPPTPPPVVALPLHDLGEEAKDNSSWKGVRFWRREKKESEDVKNGTSLRCHAEISGCCEEFESSFRRSASVSVAGSRKSREWWRVVKMSDVSCSPWSGTGFAVLAKRKFKSYISD